MQRRFEVGNLRVAPDPEARLDPSVDFAKLEDEVDGIDQKGRRPVIGQSDRLGRGDIRGNIKHQPTALISKEESVSLSLPSIFGNPSKVRIPLRVRIPLTARAIEWKGFLAHVQETRRT